MILGLDLSATRTGYAYLTPTGELLDFGSWRFPKSKEHAGSRWVKFRRALEGRHELEVISTIAYEKVMPNVQTGKGKRNAPVGQVYGSLLAVVEAFAYENGMIPLHPVHISTAKKTAGHGRFNKSEMIDAAKKMWGLSIVNEDEADAMWVAETARRTMLRSE